MSGAPPLDSLTVSPSEVNERKNLIEEIIGGATGTGDYLRAILQVQNAQLEILYNRFADAIASVNGIPNNTAGIVAESADSGNTTEVVFHYNGRDRVVTLEAVNKVVRGEVVVVSYDQGGVIPVTNVDPSYLGIGNIEFSNKESADYVYEQTPQDVTIQPGETKTLLDVEPEGQLAISAVGTSDKQHSVYDYVVDGETFSDNPLSAPLGLYNDMFEFPYPVVFSETFKVVASRSQSATGAADYFSNALLIKV